jgi:hypothetical protein
MREIWTSCGKFEKKTDEREESVFSRAFFKIETIKKTKPPLDFLLYSIFFLIANLEYRSLRNINIILSFLSSKN